MSIPSTCDNGTPCFYCGRDSHDLLFPEIQDCIGCLHVFEAHGRDTQFENRMYMVRWIREEFGDKEANAVQSTGILPCKISDAYYRKLVANKKLVKEKIAKQKIHNQHFNIKRYSPECAKAYFLRDIDLTSKEDIKINKSNPLIKQIAIALLLLISLVSCIVFCSINPALFI